jgi:hypothetical protein
VCVCVCVCVCVWVPDTNNLQGSIIALIECTNLNHSTKRTPALGTCTCH